MQNFNLSKDDPSYTLKIKHLLTIKPEGFKIRAELRHGRNATSFHRSLRSQGVKSPKKSAAPGTGVSHQKGRPMTILYGSDTGTCEALAQRLKVEASAKGFTPSIFPMNMVANNLPQNRKWGPFPVASHSFKPQLPMREAWRFFFPGIRNIILT